MRLEVGARPGAPDPRGESAARAARQFLQLPVTRVRTRTVYKLHGAFSDEQLARIREALTDPIVEESACGRLPLEGAAWVVAVGYRPGVTDNVAHTARTFVADLLELHAEDVAGRPEVYTETLYLVEGPTLTPEGAARLGRELLANELIERVRCFSRADYEAAPEDLELPLAGATVDPVAVAVPLPEDAEGLQALSRDRMLSLNVGELRAIRAHFQDPAVADRRSAAGLPPSPTDLELECFAQTWSEHCKHKIFAANIVYTDEAGRSSRIQSLFKTFIVQPTRELARQVDWLVSVFDDNAGVVRVAPELHVAYKVETHNSPSALDPYGGAITGIVGVNRDPFGTGIGASLLANVWGYCLASPFHEGPIPEGLLHPRRIREGVHRGVIDGGNQSGIPYARGFELFDPRFLGKPLVFCGTVGLMPALVRGQPSEQKAILPGDLVVMVGGRIGKDGIHGATFSSEALHGASPAQAVQIGDPITQKMMTDALLEARDLGLYRAITDNGAGGLSSSVGELARLSGGAELDLEKCPLKYAGLMPWEIFLSEAQERMTLAVPAESLEALLALCRAREVEATAIGRFTDDGSLRLRYAGSCVGELDLEFLHGGCPVMELEASWESPAPPTPDELGIELAVQEPGALLLGLVGRLNLCARTDKCRQYDHEVKGLSVVKPLVGVRGDLRADAAVMRVAHGRDEAILLAEGIAPRLADLDPAAMTTWVVDLAVRRIVAGGGRLGAMAGLDNFCWPDPVQSEQTPDGRQKLGALVRTCEALAEMTRALGVPLISGKDSMKNDSVKGGVKISIPPTLLFSALGWIPDAARALDLVPGGAGEELYLVGETGAELGGSELWAMLAESRGEVRTLGGAVPRVSPEVCRRACEAVADAHAEGWITCAHALHLGGLGVGLATMALAGGLGCEVELERVASPGRVLDPRVALFAETGGRFLLGVTASDAPAFEAHLRARQLPFGRLGRFTAGSTLRVTRGDRPVLACELSELRARYEEPFGGAAADV
ncbi:MAG: phosphoribosylformylglycinamidine synthase [Deltaproteobacteria bacterium]|nr:phosphoribosylformylglycinamidine synthase [Deltaproteobacteria bacterium]